RMGDLRARVPDAMWTFGIALAALAALPPFSGFFSKESVLRAAEHASTGQEQHVPSSVGWLVLVAGLVTALLTAAYATRLFLLAFRGGGPDTPDEHGVPVVMNAVLWVLAIPTIGLGVAVGALPEWFDSTPLTPTLATSVLGVGLALIGVITTYGAWRAGTARRRAPLGAGSAPHEIEPAATAATATPPHEQVR